MKIDVLILNLVTVTTSVLSLVFLLITKVCLNRDKYKNRITPIRKGDNIKNHVNPIFNPANIEPAPAKKDCNMSAIF